MTRYSRSESFSCSAFCGSLEHSDARISASWALTYLPPFATLRTAVVSSVGALSLVMYPDPPARSTRLPCTSSECMLRMSTGRVGNSRLMSPSKSRPLRPGMEKSKIAMSHSSLRASSRASSPLVASPTTVAAGSAASICFSPWRTIGWSSAMRIRMVLYPVSFPCWFRFISCTASEKYMHGRRAWPSAVTKNLFPVKVYLHAGKDKTDTRANYLHLSQPDFIGETARGSNESRESPTILPVAKQRLVRGTLHGVVAGLRHRSGSTYEERLTD